MSATLGSTVLDKAEESFREKVLRKAGESIEMKEKFFMKYAGQIEALSREMAARFRPNLDRVVERYGVPGRIIAGIWGIESNFGGFSGTRPTVPALATLAWDPRRSALFRRELFDALEILNRGDIDARNPTCKSRRPTGINTPVKINYIRARRQRSGEFF